VIVIVVVGCCRDSEQMSSIPVGIETSLLDIVATLIVCRGMKSLWKRLQLLEEQVRLPVAIESRREGVALAPSSREKMYESNLFFALAHPSVSEGVSQGAINLFVLRLLFVLCTDRFHIYQHQVLFYRQ
jgi:hypothetical protein